MNLNEELDQLFKRASSKMPVSLLASLEASIREMKEGQIAERALKAGAFAPAFILPNARGTPIALLDKLSAGPVVLSFYRGGWCPYCSLELRAFQAALEEIRAAGGDVIAVSPQALTHAQQAAQTNALEFDLLWDRGNRVAAEFGLAYETPPVVMRTAAMFGVDIVAVNAGDPRLPISATYVVDVDRRIALAHIEADYRVRLEPSAALAMVQRLVENGRAMAPPSRGAAP